MEKIKDNIYVETHYLGCNPSFVVTSGGVVMIDTPGLNPLEAWGWKKEIERHGNVAYIINTDHHWDHAFGNYFFSGDIIMQEGTRKRMLDEGRVKDPNRNFERLLDPHLRSLTQHYFVRKPKLTYGDRMSLHLGEDLFELIHISGHTQDETLVYLPRQKALFTGDNVCTLGIPNLSESSPQGWFEALKLMEGLDIDVVVPGHGEIGNKECIQAFHGELSSLLDQVKEKIGKGCTRDEVVEQVSYEDKIHHQYSPENSERSRRNVKSGIGRLYDFVVKP